MRVDGVESWLVRDLPRGLGGESMLVRSVNIQAVSFPGDTGESIFQVRDGGASLKKFIMVDVGFEPTTPKNPWSVDDAICLGISGLLVRLTTCKMLSFCLPKLSL